ncbi:MAG: undecaprenyldiphospho-muramoylpentapeptide beta-N-acetylglucosaminyltransferase [Spirosomaceae bacterium]|nr:undecaprenyldiphospho-muramoylpentapeptide beta-N-acetylglucosaminyltransferase [Spirosomataceae bacterium]
MNAKKIIISGGGTGGHIYPAVAIANELREQNPEIEILFVGAEGKMEMEKVPREGYKIVGLPIAGINRSNLLANINFPFKVINSLRIARRVIKDFAPDAVVGVGGYASGPTLMAAGWMGIPTLIQEQNSYAGVTNKLLAKRAKKICVAYPNMEKFFPSEKILITGNPVRKDISESKITKEIASEKFGLSPEKTTVLIIGGSQGARSINEAILKDVHKIIAADVQVIWQTGKGFLEKAQNATEDIPKGKLHVAEFIYDMPAAYAAANLVASRAGALSVSELSLVGKPVILVPFPHAAEDHQTQNAMSLVNADAAKLVLDKAADTELVAEILALADDVKLQEKLARKILKFVKPDAGINIASEVLKICK